MTRAICTRIICINYIIFSFPINDIDLFKNQIGSMILLGIFV